jgi:DNA-3-methyladenine glycosylase II
MPADAAHEALCAIHGIGPWTADIYLLFCLGHPDAWPAGDLALQEAARLAFGLPARPNAKQINVLAEPWRPWRGVAARLLWAYYRAVKQRDVIPVQPAESTED